MGTWGTGLFESDDALDWVGDFLEDPTPAFISRTFERLLDPTAEDFAEALDTDRDAVLAAAEVVAALRGKPSPDLPEELGAWIVDIRSPWPTGALEKPSRRAVSNIRGHTQEFLSSWNNPDDAAGWVKNVDDVLRRLG